MPDKPTSWLAALLPAAQTASPLEQLRASTGALLALGLTGWIGVHLLGADGAWLIAPMGASSVLLFCLPASPLAQPWAVIGGNVTSALAGVVAWKLLGDPLLAAALAGGLAIAAMFALRCLHPPGGAVALTAVLAGPAVHKLGFAFALVPVALNSALMVGAALLLAAVSGRRYPHAQRSPLHNPHLTADAAPTARLGFQREDLDAVLRRYNEVLDVSRDDLEGIILATEAQAYERRFGVITCGAVMSKDVVTVEYGTALDEAWRAMRHHRLHAMPVLNPGRRVIGMVAQSDFLRHCDLDELRTLGERFRALLKRSGLTHSTRPEVVGQIMHGPVVSASVDTPIVELVPLMANSGLHHLPVLDAERRFAGIISQSDLLAALVQAHLREPAAA
jgi:CBS domain-containing membrane protein